MTTQNPLASRLVLASASLREGSMKVAIMIGRDGAGKKVQMSWGSAMRR